MIVESSACSSTLALHPITRLEAHVGVNVSGGTQPGHARIVLVYRR
jgi:hypothetical protein